MKQGRVFPLIAFLIFAFTAGVWAQAPGAAGPVNSIDDALVRVVIGDVRGASENLGRLTSQVSPSMDGAALRTLIGMQLKDPQLQGLPEGAGACFLFFPPTQWVLFVEVPSADRRDIWQDALSKMKQNVAIIDDMIVVVPPRDQASMNLAKRFAAEVQSRFLAGPGEPKLKVTIQAARLAEMFEPQALALIPMLSAMQPQAQPTGPGAGGKAPASMMAGQMKILEGEIRGFMALFKQLDILEIEVDFTEKFARMNFTMDAKPGSNVGKFFNAPAPSTKDLAQLLPAKGAVRGAITYNGKALNEMIAYEAKKIIDDMKVDAEGRKAFEDWLGMLDMYGGGFAMDILQQGPSLMNGVMLYSTDDPEKALELLSSSPEKMAGFLEMFEKMGIKMTMNFLKDNRQHKGVSIHRYEFSMDMTNNPSMQMAPGMGKLMGALFGGEKMSYDIAIVDKALIYSMGVASIEEMIDAAQAKSHPGNQAFMAERINPENGTLYIDINVAALAQLGVTIAKVVGGESVDANLLARIPKALEGASDIMMAGYWGTGDRASVNLAVPNNLIAKLPAAFQVITEMTFSNIRQGNAQGGSPIAVAERDLNTIRTALEGYMIDNRSYPKSLQSLTSPIKYLASIPKDPFSPNGESYKYQPLGKSFKLWSVGPDGVDNQGAVIFNSANGPTSAGDIVTQPGGQTGPLRQQDVPRDNARPRQNTGGALSSPF